MNPPPVSLRKTGSFSVTRLNTVSIAIAPGQSQQLGTDPPNCWSCAAISSLSREGQLSEMPDNAFCDTCSCCWIQRVCESHLLPRIKQTLMDLSHERSIQSMVLLTIGNSKWRGIYSLNQVQIHRNPRLPSYQSERRYNTPCITNLPHSVE
jgi:hypothetical protein